MAGLLGLPLLSLLSCQHQPWMKPFRICVLHVQPLIPSPTPCLPLRTGTRAALGTIPSTTAAIVVDAEGQSAPEAPVASAEFDDKGRPYLESEKWQKMGGTADETPGVFARIFSGLYGDLPLSDRLRVAWLAGTLFFIIGG